MRRLLYIGTPIFGYSETICAEFRRQGWSVDYYNDRPSENPLEKGLTKLRPSLTLARTRAYFTRIIAETSAADYDLILIINGKTLTKDDLEQLRDRHPRAQIVLYLWDAVRLYPHVVSFFDIADRCYSFDTEDCETYERLSLLPLFYGPTFEAVGKVPVQGSDFDLVSVCTVHANRQSVMSWLFPELERRGLRIYSYPFLNPLQYLYNRVFDPVFKSTRARDFKFRPLPMDDYRAVLEKSAAVYDMNHSAQDGLTMRTIETLGARRRLVTSNENIVRYRFYDPHNILVVDPAAPDPVAIAAFLEGDPVDLDEEQYRLYGLPSWVDEISTGRNHHHVSLFLR